MLAYWAAGTLWVLASEVIVFAGLVGVGLAVRRAAGLRALATRDVLVAFWVGLAAVMLLLTAWSFFWRISTVPLAVVLVVGAAGLTRSRRELRALPRGEPSSWSLGVLVVLALAALWVGNLGRAPMVNTDSMLYHLQGVRWAKQYPTPPGLANLFGPLGFNNTSFLYDAMVDVGPWAGRAYHIANGVLILPLVWQGLLGLVAVWRGTGAGRIQGGFDAALLGAAVNMGVGPMQSFATTLPATAVVLVAAAGAHRLLLEEAEDPRAAAYDAVAIIGLLTLAVTFKVSLTVFAGLIGLITLWRLLKLRGFPRVLRARALRWGTGLALLTGLLWMARGVVLSGYLLFPSSRLSLPVDWRVPKEHAIGEFGYAAESARASVESHAGILHELPFGQWFSHWAEVSLLRQPFDAPAPAGFTLAALAWFGFLRLGRRGRLDPVPKPWLLMVASLAGIAVWFRVAPEARYAASMVWTAFAVVVAACLRVGTGPFSTTLAIGALVAAGTSPAIVRPLMFPEAPVKGASPIRRVIYGNLHLPGPESALMPPRRRPDPVTRYRTDSGLVLNLVPHWCWDLPLPCTPNPARNLRLRVPGRLDKGFAVDGPWQMENWPPGRTVFRAAWAERRRRERGGSPDEERSGSRTVP